MSAPLSRRASASAWRTRLKCPRLSGVTASGFRGSGGPPADEEEEEEAAAAAASSAPPSSAPGVVAAMPV